MYYKWLSINRLKLAALALESKLNQDLDNNSNLYSTLFMTDFLSCTDGADNSFGHLFEAN